MDPLLQRNIASLMAEAVTVDILLRGDPYCVLRDLCGGDSVSSEVVAFVVGSISDGSGFSGGASLAIS